VTRIVSIDGLAAAARPQFLKNRFTGCVGDIQSARYARLSRRLCRRHEFSVKRRPEIESNDYRSQRLPIQAFRSANDLTILRLLPYLRKQIGGCEGGFG
jgi:hypothetical protein